MIFSTTIHRSSSLLFSFILLSLFIRIVFLNQFELRAEEAYYWNYSIHLDFGYIDHPPLIAVIIKVFTSLFGDNEFAIRCPALLSWGIMVFYIYRLSELINRGSGKYSILLLSILPFFYIDSCFSTPDMPLMAAWAASLYFLYQVFCLQKAMAWYGVGISIGLGLLAKYSMVLLIMTTGLFIIVNPEQRRKWVLRKEPYYTALLVLILFSPVIYWNATHHWISFLFQSSRRFNESYHFTFHEFIGIFILFLTPLGVFDYIKLFQRRYHTLLPEAKIKFIRTFALCPTFVFALYSCFHTFKLNWLAPCLLAIIPWLAYIMYQQHAVLRRWLCVSFILIISYIIVLCSLSYGRPAYVNKKWINPWVAISWRQVVDDFDPIVQVVHHDYPAQKPIIIPLNPYFVESELAFYQNKQRKTKPNRLDFAIHNAAMFGIAGLMYELWETYDLQGKIVILMSDDRNKFNTDIVHNQTTALSPIQSIWLRNKNTNTPFILYYYQIVKINQATG